MKRWIFAALVGLTVNGQAWAWEDEEPILYGGRYRSLAEQGEAEEAKRQYESDRRQQQMNESQMLWNQERALEMQEESLKIQKKRLELEEDRERSARGREIDRQMDELIRN